jgi:hypothetical protein
VFLWRFTILERAALLGAVSFSGVTGDGAPFTAAAQITDSGFVLLSTPLQSQPEKMRARAPKVSSPNRWISGE